MPLAGHAADKVVHVAFADAVQTGTASGKLDGNATSCLDAARPDGRVTVVNDNVTVSRKTNAFGKNDQTACNWAPQSALIALQEDVRRAGANAVTDIVSNDGGVEYRDPRNGECHVGLLMSGVQLKATLAKVA